MEGRSMKRREYLHNSGYKGRRFSTPVHMMSERRRKELRSIHHIRVLLLAEIEIARTAEVRYQAKVIYIKNFRGHQRELPIDVDWLFN